jgi:hypothetical protein
MPIMSSPEYYRLLDEGDAIAGSTIRAKEVQAHLVDTLDWSRSVDRVSSPRRDGK